MKVWCMHLAGNAHFIFSMYSAVMLAVKNHRVYTEVYDASLKNPQGI